jgi:hypothetical protein
MNIEKSNYNKKNKQIKFGKINEFIEDSLSNDELDKELDNELSEISNDYINKNLPKNYGNKWTIEDKNKLIEMLKESKDYEKDIKKIATTLDRTEGGVRGEIKKIIMDLYMEGENPEDISNELNIVYKNVKSIIKLYLENDAKYEIGNLEKENKLLKLRIENIELRKNLKKLIKS